VGANVYATQFHPELDTEGLAERIRIYKHSGYFRPDEVESLIAQAQACGVDGTQHAVLSNFISHARALAGG
jgi:GMP synthase (glutamine-hydrolysing)